MEAQLADKIKQSLFDCISPIQQRRIHGLDKLSHLHESNCEKFIFNMVELLTCREDYTHHLAYSYLLNQYILKYKRTSYELNKHLEVIFTKIYEQDLYNFSLKYSTISLINKQIVYRDSIIKLALTYYSNAYNKKYFLKEIVDNISTTNIKLPTIIYYQRLLEQMSKILTPNQRFSQGIALNFRLSKLLQHFWHNNNEELAILLSYYAPFSSQFLTKKMIQIQETNVDHKMLFIMIKKFALKQQRFQPSLQILSKCYRITKSLMFNSDYKTISKENKYHLYLLYGKIIDKITQKCIQNEITEEQSRYIFSIIEYDQLVSFITINIKESQSLEDIEQYQGHENLSIQQASLNIIQKFSKNLPKQDLQQYYNSIHFNITNNTKLLYLLCGATAEILQVTRCGQAINRIIIGQTILSSPKQEFLYFKLIDHFIETIDNKQLSISFIISLYRFLRNKIQQYSNQIQQQYQSNQKYYKLEKISLLFNVFKRLLCNGMYLMDQNNQLTWMIDKLITFWIYSYQQQNTLEHQKLNDIIQEIIVLNRSQISKQIALGVIRYYEMFFFQKQHKKRVFYGKLRLQTLSIFEKSINLNGLSSQNSQHLNNIMNQIIFEENIIRQCLPFILKILYLNNELKFISNNGEIINFQVIHTLHQILLPIILSILRLEQYQTYLQFLNTNLNYQFINSLQNQVSQYEVAIKILIALSFDQNNHKFIQEIIDNYLRQYDEIKNKVYQMKNKVNSRFQEVRKIYGQLCRILSIFQSLICVLYLNPRWHSEEGRSQSRKNIMQNPLCIKIRQSVEDMRILGVSKSLHNMNLQGRQYNQELFPLRQIFNNLSEDNLNVEIINELFSSTNLSHRALWKNYQ